MRKMITLDFDEQMNTCIKCGEKNLVVSKTEKTINAKSVFDLLEYDLENKYDLCATKAEIDNEPALTKEEREARRLFNSCYDLLSNLIEKINIKTTELISEKAQKFL